MKQAFAITLLLLALNTFARARVIPLKKDKKESSYKVNHGAQPGDTIQLEGHYRLINLINVNGTKDKPIVIINKGMVTVSGYASYCFVITGKYFKILGNGSPSIKYGIQISGFDSVYSASGLGLTTSSDYEVAYIKISHTKVGFFQNPVNATDMANIYIHNCYISDLDNPKELGRAEGFYIGNTHKVSPGKFKNFRIENNILENLSGDGIQVCQGDFTIKNNTIRNWAKAQLRWQRNGILVGEGTTSTVENNLLEGGHGVAYENFGGGEHTFKNNTIKNVDVSMLPHEDIVYLDGRGANFKIDFSGNTFENVKANRKVIYNQTADSFTTGSIFKNNAGLTSDQLLLYKKDTLTQKTTEK